ncbi:MAG TPA: hypothetical protein VGW75_06890 [Solirubrobacteraceae bacterium]|jgi:hypothetical protein|nr:hypothetical protein [Solirubrobacteraceae bacterium]
MWRWPLFGVMFLGTSVVAALVYEHVPRLVFLAVLLALGTPTLLFMEANLERRRRSRAGR